MASLLERYRNATVGVLSCWDRVSVHGTLPGRGHAAGMTASLKMVGARIVQALA